MQKQVVPLLLCGGLGTRLYPLSRHNYPKQFLHLVNYNTLLQETAKRFNSNIFTAPIIITSSEQAENSLKQLNTIQIKPSLVITEPMRKNTAAAIICGSIAAVQKFGEEALVISSPSDQVWYDSNDLLRVIDYAVKKLVDSKKTTLAPAKVENCIIAFGTKPSNPSSQFGYIKLQEAQNRDAITNLQYIESFIEKPSLELAIEYLESDCYLWNSGIYLAYAQTILDAAKSNCLELYNHCYQAMEKAEFYQADDETEIANIRSTDFSQIVDFSIEDALIIKNKNLRCVEIKSTDWNDLGSWEGLLQAVSTKKHKSLKDVVDIDSKNSYIYSSDKKVIAIGIRDLIALNLDDHLLLLNSEQIEKIKVELPEIIANSKKIQTKTADD